MKNHAKLSARNALTGNYTDPALYVIIMLVISLSLVLINQLAAKSENKFSFIIFAASVILFAVSVSTVKFIMSARLLKISEKAFGKGRLSVVRIIKGGFLSFFIGIIKLFYLAAFMILPTVFSFAVYLRVSSDFVSVISLIINAVGLAVLLAVSAVFYGISVQKFSRAIHCFAEKPSISIENAIKSSIESTKGKQLRIFIFKCSFFPWLISGLLLLPLMFVLPYYEESFIFYCRINATENKA